MNQLPAKDIKFDLLLSQSFNRYICVNFLLIDISKGSVRENHIVF